MFSKYNTCIVIDVVDLELHYTALPISKKLVLVIDVLKETFLQDFQKNSETNASEFPENIEKIFRQYHMHSNAFNSSNT